MTTKRPAPHAHDDPHAHLTPHAPYSDHVHKEGEFCSCTVERRILRFVNAARMPEDFLRPPQAMRATVGEHDRLHGDLPIARAGHEEEHQATGPAHDGMHPPPPKKDMTAEWKRIRLDRKTAIEILRHRPPLGYRHLRELLELDARITRGWLDVLVSSLSDAQYGSWSAPIPIEVGGTTYPIQNAAMLRTGKVLLVVSGTDTVLWDPNNAATPIEVKSGAVTGLTANLFCSGHSFLSNGRLLVAGGGGGGPGHPTSIQAWRFDPIAETWSRTGTDMAFKRWYPTVVTLGDEPGRALVISGWTGGIPGTAPQMEIYSETTDSFTPVTTAGPVGEKVGPQTYPGIHMLPGGELFYAPVGFGDCGQTASAYAATEESGYFVFDGATSGSWHNTGVNIRTKGMSVLLLQPTYPYVRVLVVGGGTAAQSATAQLINLSTLSPSWGSTFPLLQARVHPNVVLLPDGTVFICGGMEATGTPSTGGLCELYDPVAGTLTEMDEVAYPRHYHSAALLLPSGQVMVAGGASAGGCSLSDYNSIEVYSPPYLFKGARPTMSPLPTLVHHGQSFAIQTPDADAIARVVLVRPMAVTHQTDTEQRVVQLQFMQTGPQELVATMPNGAHPHGAAPRGHFLLFILTGGGVPSLGQFVFLH